MAREDKDLSQPEARPQSALVPDRADGPGAPGASSSATKANWWREHPDSYYAAINEQTRKSQAMSALWRGGRSGGDGAMPSARNDEVDPSTLRQAAFQRMGGQPLIPLSDPKAAAPAPPSTTSMSTDDPGIPLSNSPTPAVAPKIAAPSTTSMSTSLPLSAPQQNSSYALEPQAPDGAMDPGVPLTPKRKKSYNLEPEAQPAPQPAAKPESLDKASEALNRLANSTGQFPDKIKEMGKLFDDLQSASKKLEAALADTSGSAAEQAMRKKVASANLDDKLAAAKAGPQDATPPAAKSDGMPAMLQALIAGVGYKVAGPSGGMLASLMTSKGGALSDPGKLNSAFGFGGGVLGGIGKWFGFGGNAAPAAGGAPGAAPAPAPAGVLGGIGKWFGFGGKAAPAPGGAPATMPGPAPAPGTAPGMAPPGPAMPGAAPAAAAGAGAAAGGGGGLMAALATNAGLELLGSGLSAANQATSKFVTGMAQTLGVPKSIAELGGAVTSLFSPLRALEVGVKLTQFALLPLMNIDKPGEVLKDVLGGIANVGARLATVFLDMRDPAAMLASAVGPFVSTVSKFNPAATERMNIAFDNLSAAAGRMFTPIITAVTEFADQLNVLYTAIAGPAQAIISSVVGPIKAIALEFVYGMVNLAIDAIPTLEKAFIELKPIARDFGKFIISGSGWVIEAFGKLVSCIRPGIDLFNEWWPEIKAFAGGVAAVGVVLAAVALGPVAAAAAPFIAVALAAGVVCVGLKKMADGLAEWWVGNTAAVPNVSASTEAANQRIANRNNALYGQPHDPVTGAPVDLRAAAAARNANAPAPAMTIAAQPARHVGIEDVGLEARRSAFSQGSDPATQTATNTQNTAQNTASMRESLQSLAATLGIQLRATEIAQQQGST